MAILGHVGTGHNGGGGADGCGIVVVFSLLPIEWSDLADGVRDRQCKGCDGDHIEDCKQHKEQIDDLRIGEDNQESCHIDCKAEEKVKGQLKQSQDVHLEAYPIADALILNGQDVQDNVGNERCELEDLGEQFPHVKVHVHKGHHGQSPKGALCTDEST